MLISNVFSGQYASQQTSKPPEAEKTERPSESANSPEQAKAEPANASRPAQNSAAPQEASKAQSAPPPSRAQQAQGTAQVQSTKAAPGASDADNEAFARAAAQRNVDNQRTRALLDTIAPVNNSAVEAAKSYVTKVEPEAQTDTADKTASAAKSSLDKAA